jgi:hypothetical protein
MDDAKDEAARAALLSGAAAFLALPIDPAMQPGVAQNLALLRQHADRVMEFVLPAGEEVAPVFRPCVFRPCVLRP